MFNNWKTTLAGFGAGALNMFANGTNWKQILFSTGLAVIGWLAKDFNVTNASPSTQVQAAPTTK
jgi:hypothetical protein